MPSDKKRVNLTIPDPIYEKLQAYKEEAGLFNDATACLQLIVQQLNSIENSKLIFSFVKNTPTDQLLQASKEGFDLIKEASPNGVISLPQESEAP